MVWLYDTGRWDEYHYDVGDGDFLAPVKLIDEDDG